MELKGESNFVTLTPLTILIIVKKIKWPLSLLGFSLESVECALSASTQPQAARNGGRQQCGLGAKLGKFKCRRRNGCSRKRTERGNSEV